MENSLITQEFSRKRSFPNVVKPRLNFQMSSNTLIQNQIALLTINAKADFDLDIGLYSGKMLLTADGIQKYIELNINVDKPGTKITFSPNNGLIKNLRNMLINPSILGKFFVIWR